jgi:hypothetical protein
MKRYVIDIRSRHRKLKPIEGFRFPRKGKTLSRLSLEARRGLRGVY